MWRIGIAFLIGQCAVHALWSLPTAWPWAIVLLASLAVATIFRRKLLVALLLGMGWAWGHAHQQLADDLPSELEGRDLAVVGRIASLPQWRDVDPQFDVAVVSSEESGVPRRLRLAWYDSDAQPQPGELWQFVVRLKRRNGFANPGGFDYEGLLFRSGVGATGYVREDERNRLLAPPGIHYPVLRARDWLATHIAEAAGNTPMLGILQGLAVGDTRAMLPAQWRVIGATGMTHLMAISGLHISMVAALAAWCGGSIVRWRGAQARSLTALHGQAIAGIGAALAYSLLAGMSVPTQRTLVMLCLFFAARLARRELNVANLLGIALIGVTLIDPFAPLAMGAWLSFGAVVVILFAVAGRLRRERAIANFFRVQWAVSCGLLPVLALGFGSFSLISPLANAIAVPFFSLLIVPLVLIGTLLAAIWMRSGEFVLGLTARVLEMAWPLFEWLSELPLAMWYLPHMPWPHYVALACGAVSIVLPAPWPLRLAAVALCIPAITHRPATPERGNYTVAVLDVGQGLATVVRTRSHTLIYDTGPAFRTGRDTGELVVLPYLRNRGVRAVDRLIVSHGDLDHRGGMQSILTHLRTRAVSLGPSVVEMPGAERCRRGQRWVWDAVEFEVLHPDIETFASDNDTSCVLRIVGRGGATLLTGDIEEAGELTLIRASLPPAELVVIPHHGSRSSSTEGFVAATQATLAVVSAGYRNRWNFPKEDIVARWRAAGARVVSTIDSGAVEIEVTERDGWRIQEYRCERRRYWSPR